MICTNPWQKLQDGVVSFRGLITNYFGAYWVLKENSHHSKLLSICHLLREYNRGIVFMQLLVKVFCKNIVLKVPEKSFLLLKLLKMYTKIFQMISQRTLFWTLYGYVITNQGVKAESFFLKFLESGKIKSLDIFSDLDEAEEFCISDGVGLTPTYWLYRSQIFLLSQKYDRAIKYCNNALELDKNFYQAYSARSIAYARKGDFTKAFDDINLAIKKQPSESAFRARAAVHILNEDFKNAIFDYSRAIRINPQDVLAYVGRSAVYVQSEKYRQGLKDLDEALVLSKDDKTKSFVYFVYAENLLSLQEWEKSINYLDKFIQIQPTAGAYRRKANALVQLAQYEEAKKYYQLSLELDQENPYAYLGQGKLLILMGDYQNAIDVLEMAKTFEQRSDFFLQNEFGAKEIHLRLWEAYLKMESEEYGEKEKRILIDTEKEKQLVELVRFCAKYQQFEALLEVGLKLATLSDDNTDYSNLAAGYALNMLGRFEEALEYFSRGEHLSKRELLKNYFKINIGMSYYGMKDMQKTLHYFEEANLNNLKKPTQGGFSSFKRKISEFLS